MTYRPGTVSVPAPSFRTIEEAQSWAEQAFAYLKRIQHDMNAILTEARKLKGDALTAANAGTVNSGDATTDDVIEANRTRIAEIEAILVANGLVEE